MCTNAILRSPFLNPGALFAPKSKVRLPPAEESAPPPPPSASLTEGSSQVSRDAVRRRALAARGRGSTIVTSGLGLATPATSAPSALLGT